MRRPAHVSFYAGSCFFTRRVDVLVRHQEDLSLDTRDSHLSLRRVRIPYVGSGGGSEDQHKNEANPTKAHIFEGHLSRVIVLKYQKYYYYYFLFIIFF